MAARSSIIGVAVLFAALAFGGALLLDVGGLQSRLFAEGPPERPPVAAKLPEKSPAMVRQIGPVQSVGATGNLSNATVRRNKLIDPNITGGISVLASDLGTPGV